MSLSDVGIAILVEEIKVVFSLIGAVGGNITGFIAPAAIYLKILSQRKRDNLPVEENRFLFVMAWLSVIFGIISAILCLTATIISFVWRIFFNLKNNLF